MSKIKLIIGNSPSHLLAMAETMAFRKNYQVISGKQVRENRNAFSKCSRETEVVIIHELPVLRLYTTLGVLSSGQIYINHINQDAFMHTVDVIITCLCKREWVMNDRHLLRRVTLIESRVSSRPDVQPVQIPVRAAGSIGEEYFKDQVIVLSWDKGTGSTTVTAWGKTPEDMEQANQIGENLKSDYHNIKQHEKKHNYNA